ncbi:MAG: hypothetical protein M0T75_06295 [Chloroflexi bacterium]|nr:hypothetical protein [Chloroflexota bacterium]
MDARDQGTGLPGGRAAGADAEPDDAAALAEAELRAAIAVVALRPGYRVIVCGMATEPRLVARLDALAAAEGVVLDRRIRPGGGLDVVVRCA